MATSLVSYTETASFTTSASPQTVTGLSWEVDDVIVWGFQCAGPTGADLPTNANLTFTLLGNTPGAGTSASGGAFAARATSTQTGQTISQTDGFGNNRGASVWIIRGGGPAVLEAANTNAGGSVSVTCALGDAVIALHPDWDEDNNNDTILTGSGTATERRDSNGGGYDQWCGDWTDTAAGTFDFGYSDTGGDTNVVVRVPASAGATPAAPGVPTAVSATGGDSQVVIDWTDETAGVPNPTYEVRRQIGAGAFSTIATAIGVGVETYTDATAVNGTTYTYSVRATNSEGDSAWVDTAAVTPADPFGNIVGLPKIAAAEILAPWVHIGAFVNHRVFSLDALGPIADGDLILIATNTQHEHDEDSPPEQGTIRVGTVADRPDPDNQTNGDTLYASALALPAAVGWTPTGHARSPIDPVTVQTGAVTGFWGRAGDGTDGTFDKTETDLTVTWPDTPGRNWPTPDTFPSVLALRVSADNVPVGKELSVIQSSVTADDIRATDVMTFEAITPDQDDTLVVQTFGVGAGRIDDGATVPAAWQEVASGSKYGSPPVTPDDDHDVIYTQQVQTATAVGGETISATQYFDWEHFQIRSTFVVGFVDELTPPTGGGSEGSIAKISSSGQSVPGTAWSLIDYGAVDLDVNGIVSAASGVYTPQNEGYYLILAEARFQCTHNNRVDIEHILQKNGVDVAGSVDAGYGRNTQNPMSWMRACGAFYFNGTTDTFQVNHRRDTGAGTPAGSYTWTRIKIVQLTAGAEAATPFGHYGTPTTGNYAGTTEAAEGSPTAASIVSGFDVISETDTSVIELQAGGSDISLKDPDRPYLAIYSMPTDASGGSRTTRVSDLTLAGTRVSHSAGYAYQRDAANQHAVPSGMALVKPAAASDLNVRVWGYDDDKATLWGTWVRSNWTLSDAPGRAGVMVIALPATTDVSIFDDSAANQTFNGNAVAAINFANVEAEAGAAFTRDSPTQLTAAADTDIFGYSAYMVERTASSGTRLSNALRFEVAGVDLTNETEFGKYLRGEQGAQDCKNAAMGITHVGTVAVGDTIRVEKFDPGTDDGNNDVTSWGGSFFIDLATLAAPSAAATVELPHIASTSTLNAPSVSAAAVTVGLPLVDSTTTLFAPSVTTEAASVVLPFISSTSTLHAPTVTSGSVTVALPHIASVSTLSPPNVIPGAAVVGLPHVASTSGLHPPSVASGAVTIQLPHIASTSTPYPPSVSSGAVTVALPLIASTSTLVSPLVTPQPASVILPHIASTSSLAPPSVSSGSVSVQLPHIASTSTLAVPTITPQAVTVQLPHIASTSALHPPSAAPQHVTIELASIASTSTLRPPAVEAQAVTVDLPHIASTTALRPPTVAPEGSAVVLPRIESTGTLHPPTITPQSVTIELPAITSASTMAPPSVARVELIELPHIASTSTTHSPVVAPQGTGITLAVIASTSTLHSPTVEPQPVGVELPHIASTSTLHMPQVRDQSNAPIFTGRLTTDWHDIDRSTSWTAVDRSTEWADVDRTTEWNYA